MSSTTPSSSNISTPSRRAPGGASLNSEVYHRVRGPPADTSQVVNRHPPAPTAASIASAANASTKSSRSDPPTHRASPASGSQKQPSVASRDPTGKSVDNATYKTFRQQQQAQQQAQAQQQQVKPRTTNTNSGSGTTTTNTTGNRPTKKIIVVRKVRKPTSTTGRSTEASPISSLPSGSNTYGQVTNASRPPPPPPPRRPPPPPVPPPPSTSPPSSLANSASVAANSAAASGGGDNNAASTTMQSPVALSSRHGNSTSIQASTVNSRIMPIHQKHNESFLRKRREYSPADTKTTSTTTTPIELEEQDARQQASHNPIVLFFTNFMAAIKIFILYLISIETIVCNMVTVGMTYYWWEIKENNPAWHGAMSFVLVSFAVATPITSAIRMAFDRREKALLCIANVRSFALHIYLAHALWDWKGQDGRKNAAMDSDFNFEEHCDQVLHHLIGIGDEMTRFLTLPTFSTARHRVLGGGRTEARRTLKVAYHLLDSTLVQHMTRLTVLAERLKSIGLSGSEISRIRQYERHFTSQLEQLRMYKVYRTPQALWAFARIFTLLLPPFYAPTFTEVARELHHLWLGIAFAMITSTVLTSLFESVQILEDPFVAFVSTLDGIDVSEELEVLQWTQLINARKLLFPQCSDYPMQTKPAISMTGTNTYDPTVHYHSTPELREMLMGRNFGSSNGNNVGGGMGDGAAGAYDIMTMDDGNNATAGAGGNENGDVEAAANPTQRTRRKSRFAIKTL